MLLFRLIKMWLGDLIDRKEKVLWDNVIYFIKAFYKAFLIFLRDYFFVYVNLFYKLFYKYLCIILVYIYKFFYLFCFYLFYIVKYILYYIYIYIKIFYNIFKVSSIIRFYGTRVNVFFFFFLYFIWFFFFFKFIYNFFFFFNIDLVYILFLYLYKLHIFVKYLYININICVCKYVIKYIYLFIYYSYHHYFYIKYYLIKYYYIITNLPYTEYRDFIWKLIFKCWDIYEYVKYYFFTAWHCSFTGYYVHVFFAYIHFCLYMFFVHDLLSYAFYISPKLHYYIYIIYTYCYKVHYFLLLDCHVILWYYGIKASLYYSMMWLYNYTVYLFLYYFPANWNYPYRILMYCIDGKDFSWYYFFFQSKSIYITLMYVVPLINYLMIFLEWFSYYLVISFFKIINYLVIIKLLGYFSGKLLYYYFITFYKAKIVFYYYYCFNILSVCWVVFFVKFFFLVILYFIISFFFVKYIAGFIVSLIINIIIFILNLLISVFFKVLLNVEMVINCYYGFINICLYIIIYFIKIFFVFLCNLIYICIYIYMHIKYFFIIVFNVLYGLYICIYMFVYFLFIIFIISLIILVLLSFVYFIYLKINIIFFYKKVMIDFNNNLVFLCNFIIYYYYYFVLNKRNYYIFLLDFWKHESIIMINMFGDEFYYLILKYLEFKVLFFNDKLIFLVKNYNYIISFLLIVYKFDFGLSMFKSFYKLLKLVASLSILIIYLFDYQQYCFRKGFNFDKIRFDFYYMYNLKLTYDNILTYSFVSENFNVILPLVDYDIIDTQYFLKFLLSYNSMYLYTNLWINDSSGNNNDDGDFGDNDHDNDGDGYKFNKQGKYVTNTSINHIYKIDWYFDFYVVLYYYFFKSINFILKKYNIIKYCKLYFYNIYEVLTFFDLNFFIKKSSINDVIQLINDVNYSLEIHYNYVDYLIVILNKRYIEYIYTYTLFLNYFKRLESLFLFMKSTFKHVLYKSKNFNSLFINIYKFLYSIYFNTLNFYDFYIKKISELFNMYMYIYIENNITYNNSFFYPGKNYFKSNVLKINLNFYKSNSLMKFLFRDFFFNKHIFRLVYNNKFFDYYSLLLFKKYYAFDFLKNELFDIILSKIELNKDNINYNTEIYFKNNLIRNNNFKFDDLVYYYIDFVEIANIKSYKDENLVSTINTESFFFVANYYYNNYSYYIFNIDLLLGDYFKDLMYIYKLPYVYYIDNLYENTVLKNPYKYVNELVWLMDDSFNFWDYVEKNNLPLNLYNVYSELSDQMDLFEEDNFNDGEIGSSFLLKSLNLEIYDQFIYFDEYSYNFINIFIIPFLYEVILLYSFNNFKYINIQLYNIIDFKYNYFYINLLYETQTYWDIYIYFLLENLSSKLLINPYIYKKHNFIKKYFIRDFKYRKDYTKKELKNESYLSNIINNDYIFCKDFYNMYNIDLIPFYKMKKKKWFKFNKNYILEDDFRPIDGYQYIDDYSFLYDLDFYVEYNTFMRLIHQNDQDLVLYSQFELNTLIQKAPIKFINERFFKFLDSNLLSDSLYQLINSYERIRLDLQSTNKFYNKYNYEYKEYDMSDRTGFFSDDVKFFAEGSETFVPESDVTLYEFLTNETPFEAKNKYLYNFIEYTGFRKMTDFSNLEFYFCNFFFDYYIYSMKVLLLDFILINEYNYYLNTTYIIGPVKEYVTSRTNFTFFEKCVFFFKKFIKNALDLNSYENLYIEYKNFKFYYGYFLQFPIFLIAYCLQHIYIFFFFFKTERYYYHNVRYFQRRFLRYVQIPPFIYDIIFDFFNFPDVPFKNAYLYNISDFEGFYDKDFIITSLVYETVGFNGFLADLDNRYFLNSGILSTHFNYQTAGFYIFYFYLVVCKDILLIFIMRLFVFIIRNCIYFCTYINYFFNIILFVIEFFLYIVFSILHILLLLNYSLYIYMYMYIKFFVNLVVETNLYKNLNQNMYFVLIIINKALIFPFELLRIMYLYLYNNICNIIFIYYEKFFFFYKHVLFNIIFYFKYLFYIICLIMIKLVIFYFIFVILFMYYDFILIFFEKLLFIEFSYRSIFVFYSIILFIFFIGLLYPFQITYILWAFRYYYLAILFVLWFLSANINSMEILFMQYWDFIRLKASSVIYGPMFYNHFLSYANYEILWTNIRSFSSAYDFWWHPTLRYYIKLPKTLYTETKDAYFYFIYMWQHYYSFLLKINFFFVRDLNNYIVNHLNNLQSLFNFFYKKGESVFGIVNYIPSIKEYISINNYINYLKTISVRDHIWKSNNNNIFFINVDYFFFFKNYYSIFCINFLSLDSLYLNKFIYGVSGSAYLGAVNIFLQMNIYEDQKKINILRLTYYRHVFNKLRLDLWGNYVYNPYYFFSFYKRNWFLSEKDYYYKILQSYALNEEEIPIPPFMKEDGPLMRSIRDYQLIERIPNYHIPLWNPETLTLLLNIAKKHKEYAKIGKYVIGSGQIGIEFMSHFYIPEARRDKFMLTIKLNPNKYYDFYFPIINKIHPFNNRYFKDIAYEAYEASYYPSYYIDDKDNEDPFDLRLLHQTYPHAPLFSRKDALDTHGVIRKMHVSPVFFSKYLVPDLGYIGSSTWGVNWKFLQLTDISISDSFFFDTNKKPSRNNK